MRAVRFSDYDRGPQVEEVAEPEIVGLWDVIVRIGGAGLCRTDLHIIAGQMGAPLPITLGHENAGWVTAVGPGVEHLAVGDAVIAHPRITCGFCIPCRLGNDMGCTNSKFPGVSADGGMAELLKTSARALVKLPDGLEPADVAAQADAGLTAYHAVKKALPHLMPGSTVVVIGAGGVGHIGIQCLKAMSAARVIVVDPRESSLGLARQLGADETVRSDGSQVERVKELTDGLGAPVVIDFVGEGGAERDAQAILGPGGIHYVVGYGGTLEVPTVNFVASEKGALGCQVGTYVDLVELMQLSVDGRVALHNRRYPLDAVADAIADMQAGRLEGRAVLVP
jgi:NAD+-dependent secondary alcohol dehydrogenase Adh1